jgi:hypothetical protein
VLFRSCDDPEIQFTNNEIEDFTCFNLETAIRLLDIYEHKHIKHAVHCTSGFGRTGSVMLLLFIFHEIISGTFAIDKDIFKKIALLKTKFGEVRISGGAEVAIFQRLGGIKKKDPLLFFNKRGNLKYGVLYGEGIWKWKVNDFVRTGTFDAFTELVQKTTQYLLVKQNKSALHVAFPKRFTKDEDVILNATFYNDAMEAITKPKINLTLTDDKNQKSNFQFAVAGDFYKLSLGKMNPGKYYWTASATYNGKTTRKTGVFIVEDIAIESLDTYANHALLNQISSKTNGSFDVLKNYKKTIDSIKKRTDITSASYKDASFNDLIDYKILFFLLLLLIGTEWFLRRWFGSY